MEISSDNKQLEFIIFHWTAERYEHITSATVCIIVSTYIVTVCI